MVSLSLLASLRKQHLSKNSICIVSFLKPLCALTTWIKVNNIGDDGAKCLAEALKTNKTLERMDLRGLLNALHKLKGDNLFQWTTLETMERSAWLRRWRRTSHSMRSLWSVSYSILLFLPNFWIQQHWKQRCEVLGWGAEDKHLTQWDLFGV